MTSIREAQRAQIELTLEAALKQAMAYAFNKGYANDHSPDHEKANAIRDKAMDAIMASVDEYVKEVGGTKEGAA